LVVGERASHSRTRRRGGDGHGLAPELAYHKPLAVLLRQLSHLNQRLKIVSVERIDVGGQEVQPWVIGKALHELHAVPGASARADLGGAARLVERGELLLDEAVPPRGRVQLAVAGQRRLRVRLRAYVEVVWPDLVNDELVLRDGLDDELRVRQIREAVVDRRELSAREDDVGFHQNLHPTRVSVLDELSVVAEVL